MSASLPLAAFRTEFDREFKQLMAERATWAQAIDPVFAQMLDQLSTLVTRGGKRLRPYLMYLSYTGYDGHDPAGMIRLTISQELYHNAWLIHDDIIDRDLMRHGGPNIAGAYGAQFKAAGLTDADHLASSMALLAGDFSLSLAADLLLHADYPADRVLAASRRLQAVSLGETGGEMLDVLMPTVALADVTPARLLQIYRYKTAAYSFELPLHTGAILAGASSRELERLTACAMPLGIAFQIADDLLGTFGDEQTLGKPVLSDLREGKRTILLLNALKLASPAARTRLETLIGNPGATTAELAEFKSILEDCGARAETEALARKCLQESLAALEACTLTPEVRAQLQELAQFVLSRSI